MDEAKLRILIQAILDEQGFKKAQDALKNVKKSGEETGSELDKMGKTLTKVGVVAVASISPVYLAAKHYVSAVNQAEATSRKWLATEYEIEQAHIRVGRVGAQAVLPFYEKYGDIMERFSKFAEENPDKGLAAMGVAGLGGAREVLPP